MNRAQELVALAGLPVLALTFGALIAVDTNAFQLGIAFGDAWRLAAACTAFMALPLLFAIWRVALFRFFSDADRDGAGLCPEPGRALQIHRAVLQNTLEQTTLAAIAYFGFAALAAPERLALLPLYAALFVIGRIAFALGYRYGALGRAFGFGLTFAPTVTLYALTALALFPSP